ncbi:hypothetical protein MKK63_19730 [Methylobacterium sp. J-088]|uniref:hypothetical protein n=1 Tax=Methylobacterium sp. J-088 TaxID=2836664 RepID=UPI001FB9A5D9|nr:hypothetical protein [Methylobacterium sp. J-088]MCJ2064921.1 hypothetical protein [Methylobacterium sp. J-088]
MSPRGEDWLRAHAALWYGEARYRLAWLLLPQAATCAAAGLCLALAAQGGWGQPATASKARVAELSALRDRAGKDGDRKAFDELTAAATRGQIDAAIKLGTLYDPLTAAYFPRKTVPDNFARATALYGPGAAVGDLTAVSRLADVLLDPANPNRDLRRGCRLAQTWIEDPETLQRTITGEERLTVKLATCYVEPGSGLPQDPVRAGGLVTAVLWRRHPPTIDAFVNNLGQQNPALVSGLQQSLAKQGRYIGPVDGRANPGIVTALQVEAGITNTVAAPRPELRRIEPKGPEPEVRALQAAAQAGDRGKMAELESRADGGDADALTAYARLFNPVFNKGAVFAPDTQVAVAYYERAAAAGNGMAAGEAAVIYDAGWGNVAKDPRKAAVLALRSLDLKDSQSEIWLLFEEAGSWSGPFWGALQAELTACGFYKLPVENKRNAAVITALRTYIKAKS